MAPPKGSGCVKFRATVVETVDAWYSEDGELTKILCEEILNTDDVQPKLLSQCCACDEAKYEVKSQESCSSSYLKMFDIIMLIRYINKYIKAGYPAQTQILVQT